MRPHDIGGMMDFGPVNPDDPGGAFHEDWEARVFAISVALRRRGTYSSDEFRDAIEQMTQDAYLASSYYERWMHAMTTILVDKGALAGEAFADE